tara:strand:- start:39 stop:194 length:156 start_codon:yes stop_codon:yes gene_type:complete
MKLTQEERRNLLLTLSETRFWEMLPMQLEDDEIGLDHERWSLLIQRLIDEK